MSLITSAIATLVNHTSPLAQHDERAAQAVLFREVFPNPFRPRPIIDAAVLAWNNGAVVQLARDIYEANAWERMGQLVDTLEEAGCQDRDILGHCRKPGQVHVRGCFVLDLLLGKE